MMATYSPSYTKNNFNRRLEFALRAMGFKDATLYNSKVPRRGPTQELLQNGSSIACIKSSGSWIWSGFGSYIDLEFDRSLKISKILIAQMSDDSTSEEDNEPREP